jgi:peptide/nickel transport system ATP-binding protein
MQVCAAKDPVETVSSNGTRVECWLHGPHQAIPPGGDAPLPREEIGVADEA